jgi:putative ABC transport system substrate-binding protein
MKRREFITLIGGAAAAWPLAARAQQSERVRRVGLLHGLAADDPEWQRRFGALKQGLQDLGWTEGQNITFEGRFADGDILTREYRRVVGVKPMLTVEPDPQGFDARYL